MSEDTPQQSTASQPSPAAQSGPHPDQSSSSSRPDNDQPEHIVAWTASEFIAHQKDSRWYMAVIGITIVLAAAVRLLTHDNISTVMVVILGIVFCVAGARKPRMLSYAISEDGIEAGERFYPFADFKSFSVVHDGPFSSIELMPVKRFMPMTSIYCSPETEDEAIDLLAEFVPYEERDHSLIDVFARRIRF